MLWFTIVEHYYRLPIFTKHKCHIRQEKQIKTKKNMYFSLQCIELSLNLPPMLYYAVYITHRVKFVWIHKELM